jgi:hypothetical protein
MNRRAVLAHIAISLTILPACVTGVVEVSPSTAAEVVENSGSASTEKVEETLGEKARRETLEKRREPEVKRRFLTMVRRYGHPEFAPDEKQLVALWGVGQLACEFLDSDGTVAEFRELAPDSPSATGDYFEGIAEAAVFSICGEHIPKLSE